MCLGDYKINIRCGRSYFEGYDSTGKKKYRYVQEYETNKGRFSPDKWKEATMKAIEKADEVDMLEEIKEYCREHCSWLRKKDEIEEYAMDCLRGQIYHHWKDLDLETIIWM